MTSDLPRIARALVLIEIAIDHVKHIKTTPLLDNRMTHPLETLDVLLTDALDELEIINERAAL